MNSTLLKSTSYQDIRRISGPFSLVICGLILGLLVVWAPNPLYILAALSGLGFAALVITKVELGFILLVFITHSNLSTLLIEQLGAPSVAKILVSLIIISLMIRHSLYGIPLSGYKPITLLLIIYGLVGLFSMLYEPYVSSSIKSLISFGKDSIIAIITVLLVKKYSLLRQIFWALIASGAILGTIAFIQYLTGTYDNNYWGLSQAPSHQIVGKIDDFRLSGTLGDPNFFAMFQYVILPLAIDRLLSEKTLFLKILAGYCACIILFTVVFSYSRGGFLGIVVMIFSFACLYRHRAWQVVTGAIVALCILSYLPNSYYAERIFTLEYLTPDKKGASKSERSFQGRKSEMYVAVLIFMDNPLTGVGLGNYEKYYQKYAQRLLIDLRKEDREAHCRYLEILAETGLTGFAVFCSILLFMFKGLRRSWQKTRISGLTDLEYSISALSITLIGLMVGFIFLHDAWPRFSWLLVGLAYAIPNILNGELENTVSVTRDGDEDI